MKVCCSREAVDASDTDAANADVVDEKQMRTSGLSRTSWRHSIDGDV